MKLKSWTKSWAIAALMCWVATLTGCASGTKFAQMQLAPTSPEQGRVYFYRDGSMVGSAIQQGIMLNGTKVGKSIPGGFFYVNEQPGNFEVVCSTEAKKNLTFTLSAGEVKYVRTRVSIGLLVGHVTPYLEGQEQAMKTLSQCSYTGD